MYAYESIERALAVLNTVMIPASEAEKITAVKMRMEESIRAMKGAVAAEKARAAQEAAGKEEEHENQD